MSLKKSARKTPAPAAQLDWLNDSPGLNAAQTLEWLNLWTAQGLLRHIDSALAAQLLRLDPQAQPALLVAAALLAQMEAAIEGKALQLSVLEFELLKCFVQNKDRVMSRERILEAVWRDSVVSDRTVDTHIVSLRKRLAGFDHQLATVYGAGYILKKGS
jgi:DNA-binding response OmpR family regulator